MIVTDCTVGSQKMTADGARDTLAAVRHTSDGVASSAIEQLRTIAGLCNAGEFDATTRHLPLAQRKIHGGATDQALLRFAESLGSVSELGRCWQTKFGLPFNSKNKFMIRVLELTQVNSLYTTISADAAAIFEPGDP